MTLHFVYSVAKLLGLLRPGYYSFFLLDKLHGFAGKCLSLDATSIAKSLMIVIR